MSKDVWNEWAKKADQLDIAKLFVHSCNNDKIHKDLEEMSAFSQDKSIHKTLNRLVTYILHNILRQKSQQTTTTMRVRTRIRIKMLEFNSIIIFIGLLQYTYIIVTSFYTRKLQLISLTSQNLEYFKSWKVHIFNN